jgi:hypothetical protein
LVRRQDRFPKSQTRWEAGAAARLSVSLPAWICCRQLQSGEADPIRVLSPAGPWLIATPKLLRIVLVAVPSATGSAPPWNRRSPVLRGRGFSTTKQKKPSTITVGNAIRQSKKQR